jgi:hypothetical protein
MRGAIGGAGEHARGQVPVQLEGSRAAQRGASYARFRRPHSAADHLAEAASLAPLATPLRFVP